MAENHPTIKMPEVLVFAKTFATGIILTEVFRIAYYSGERLATKLSNFGWQTVALIITACLLVCAIYMFKRRIHEDAVRLGKSLRIDLLATVVFGCLANVLTSTWLEPIHSIVQQSNPWWASVVLAMLTVILLSPLAREYSSKRRKEAPQLYFITDEEIKSHEQDFFASEAQAKSFAETVMASKSNAGLVFGVDGPWGIGKTSFINLAERHWETASDGTVVVFRFEPLRHASDPNLAERFIKELSSAIQKRVFVPEFRPVASRYYRMLKGRADLSFLGFKLSLEPSTETIDELLEDIDDVLKRIGSRVIIVIDDLDRLDASAVNNVLFTVRRTFKLSQATYILCYDTDNLVNGSTDREKAREFLEKFITIKLSLFVDSTAIKKFLEHDWSNEHRTHLNIPSETMVKLASILSELASILDSEVAASYMPLLGDMRKIKRFVNAVLMMQIERTNLGRTDFNSRDLINLMLLHLNYPSVFRRIYAEETEGRSGRFPVRIQANHPNYSNSDEFSDFLKTQDESTSFLLKQLFDVAALGLNSHQSTDENQLRSRACFNSQHNRNLESYLKLIVRFVVPEPQQTFVLYRNAVDRVRKGESIELVLDEPDFRLQLVGENAHDQFWRVLVNRSYDLERSIAEDAIDTLIRHLPRYSAIKPFDNGLRHRSIYSLALLLDRAGWGEANRHRSSPRAMEIVEITNRIFGEGNFTERGIISSLASDDRGVLGWNDLMLFRLVCSADRRGQLHNIQSALVLHENLAATTTGLLSELALEGMRRLSQRVFTHFKISFIEKKINFFTEVDRAPQKSFTGENSGISDISNEDYEKVPLADRVARSRSAVKIFVIYQLCNKLPPNGSGVGCGFYDETGKSDIGEIARLMNDYIFDLCFNPDIEESNIYHFLDYCLSNLSNGFLIDEEGYFPTKNSLSGALNPIHMAQYWIRNRDRILALNPATVDRRVITLNYVASYSEDLPKVFAVLEELAGEASPSNAQEFASGAAH